MTHFKAGILTRIASAILVKMPVDICKSIHPDLNDSLKRVAYVVEFFSVRFPIDWSLSA